MGRNSAGCSRKVETKATSMVNAIKVAAGLKRNPTRSEFPGELGQRSEKSPDVWHEVNSQAGHGMSVVGPGCLAAREFVPAKNDKNSTHTRLDRSAVRDRHV